MPIWYRRSWANQFVEWVAKQKQEEEKEPDKKNVGFHDLPL